MNRAVQNVPASVRAKLLNRAKKEGRPFQELLQYYAMERFLYRLSQSNHTERFILKGGLMMQFWGGTLARSTKDIDFLGEKHGSSEEFVELIKECLELDVEDDGIRFDTGSLKGEEIRIDAKYQGVRVYFIAYLQRSRIALQIDVGFGDAVSPAPKSLIYPSLLDFEEPQILAYTPESLLSEKFHAMVFLDLANTRLKDFFDLWVLSNSLSFENSKLYNAISSTFLRRDTTLPKSLPTAFTSAFFANPTKQKQWEALLRKNNLIDKTPKKLEEIVLHLLHFPC